MSTCSPIHQEGKAVPYPSATEIETWPHFASVFRSSAIARRILSDLPECLLCTGIPVLPDSTGVPRINPIFVPWIRHASRGV